MDFSLKFQRVDSSELYRFLPVWPGSFQQPVKTREGRTPLLKKAVNLCMKTGPVIIKLPVFNKKMLASHTFF